MPATTITFHCPHDDCARSYSAPQLSLEQKCILGVLIRERESLRSAGRPLRREERGKWSHQIQSLSAEVQRFFKEFAGADADTACLSHLSRTKDVCFNCGNSISGNDLVYCASCGTPNFNW